MLWPAPKLNGSVVVVVPAGIGSCGALLDPKVKVGPVEGADVSALTLLGSATSVGEEEAAAGVPAPKEKAG